MPIDEHERVDLLREPDAGMLTGRPLRGVGALVVLANGATPILGVRRQRLLDHVLEGGGLPPSILWYRPRPARACAGRPRAFLWPTSAWRLKSSTRRAWPPEELVPGGARFGRLQAASDDRPPSVSRSGSEAPPRCARPGRGTPVLLDTEPTGQVAGDGSRAPATMRTPPIPARRRRAVTIACCLRLGSIVARLRPLAPAATAPALSDAHPIVSHA